MEEVGVIGCTYIWGGGGSHCCCILRVTYVGLAASCIAQRHVPFLVYYCPDSTLYDMQSKCLFVHSIFHQLLQPIL